MKVNSTPSNWDRFTRACEDSGLGEPSPRFCRPYLDYAVLPGVYWHREELVPAYSAEAIFLQETAQRAAVEIAFAVEAGLCIMSPVQRDRFWADVNARRVVVWEHSTNFILGVFLQGEGRPQLPVYDFLEVVSAQANATQVTEKLERSLGKQLGKGSGDTVFDYTLEQCNNNLLRNKADVMPAYRLTL